MRITISGTKRQIKDACRVIVGYAPPRNRSELAERRRAANERNQAESELMRRAFLSVRDDPAHAVMARRFAAAIYGRRSRDLIVAAETILGDPGARR